MTEIIRVSKFLRTVLLIDGISGFFGGVILTAGASYWQTVFGLPWNLVLFSGLLFFPFAAFLIYVATRKTVSKTFVWAIIGMNLLWGIDSFLLLISGNISPTEIGFGFIIFQAIGVFIFAALEFAGLRKSEIVIMKNSNQTI